MGVFPMNRPELVNEIIKRLKGVTDPDSPVELQTMQETHTSNGKCTYANTTLRKLTLVFVQV